MLIKINFFKWFNVENGVKGKKFFENELVFDRRKERIL